MDPGNWGWPVVVNVRPGLTSPSMSTYALSAGVDDGGGGTAGAAVTVQFSPRVWPGRCCPPRHLALQEPAFIGLNVSL